MINRSIKRAVAISIILTASLFFLAGYAEKLPEEETVTTEQAADDTQITSIDISVGFPSQSLGRMLTASGTVEDISYVTISVRLESDESLVADEIELTETPEGSGTWSGTLTGLPVFQSLVFEARADNTGQLT